jgi:hypothetical protein
MFKKSPLPHCFKKLVGLKKIIFPHQIMLYETFKPTYIGILQCNIREPVFTTTAALPFQRRNNKAINFHYVLIKKWICDLACPRRQDGFITILVLRCACRHYVQCCHNNENTTLLTRRYTKFRLDINEVLLCVWESLRANFNAWNPTSTFLYACMSWYFTLKNFIIFPFVLSFHYIIFGV